MAERAAFDVGEETLPRATVVKVIKGVLGFLVGLSSMICVDVDVPSFHHLAEIISSRNLDIQATKESIDLLCLASVGASPNRLSLTLPNIELTSDFKLVFQQSLSS
jgi:hypothetical protein